MKRSSDERDHTTNELISILFFDKDYNFLDAAWDHITSTAATTHDLLSISAKAPEAGYAYVFLSNEDPNYATIYFDDASIAHTPSPIVSVADYFPFGLSYNTGERVASTEQRYLYNGKELQDELALNWYDYGARMYMPEIGRWGVADPLADKARRWSPYRYAFDNPMRFIDPDGMYEYSNGYTTTNSRTETGSVSHSGAFKGDIGDVKLGSSSSQSVIVGGEKGPILVWNGDGETSTEGAPRPSVTLNSNGALTGRDEGGDGWAYFDLNGQLYRHHQYLVASGKVEPQAFANSLLNLTEGTTFTTIIDGKIVTATFDRSELYNGEFSLAIPVFDSPKSKKPDRIISYNGGVWQGDNAHSVSVDFGIHKITYSQVRGTVFDLQRTLVVHEWFGHQLQGKDNDSIGHVPIHKWEEEFRNTFYKKR
jgi:RHS repeat-associated protein